MSNFNLLSVYATVIPANAIIEADMLMSIIMTHSIAVCYDPDSQPKPIIEALGDMEIFAYMVEQYFEPYKSDDQAWHTKYSMPDSVWLKAKCEIGALSLGAHGESYDAMSGGMDWMFQEAGIEDVLASEGISQLVTIAKRRLQDGMKDKSYIYSRTHLENPNNDPLVPYASTHYPLHETNFVMVYKFWSTLDDYNHEYDCGIDPVGELDMDQIMKAVHQEPEKPNA